MALAEAKMWQILSNEARSLLASNEIEDLLMNWSVMEGAAAEGKGRWESDGRLIAQCTSLKRLCLENFGGYTSKDWLGRFELILPGLAQNRSIEELILDGYGPIACHGTPTEPDEFVHFFAILSPFFEHNHNFRTLWLNLRTLWLGTEETMFAQGTQQLVAALEKCSSLEDFELKCSQPDAEAFGDDILTALKNSPSNLTRLSLNECLSDWNGCAELGELIQSSSSLEELDLSQNRIDDEGLTLLGRVLGEKPSLKIVSMCSVGMDEFGEGDDSVTPAGWRALFEFLKSPNCALEKIFLSANRLSDESAIAIASAIATSKTLKTLRFCNIQGISPGGWCSFFAKLLQGPSSALECLLLRNCSSVDDDGSEIVDDEIATSLVNALVGNKTLRKLDLTQFQSIGSSGLVPIMISVQKLVFNNKNLGSVISSNHALGELSLESGGRIFPSNSFGVHRWEFDLSSLLRLNKKGNKDEVVQCKIGRYYSACSHRTDRCNPTDEDDEQLLRELRKEPGDLDIKVVPFVLAWAGNGGWGKRAWYLKNTLLYRLIRRVPTVFSSA